MEYLWYGFLILIGLSVFGWVLHLIGAALAVLVNLFASLSIVSQGEPDSLFNTTSVGQLIAASIVGLAYPIGLLVLTSLLGYFVIGALLD